MNLIKSKYPETDNAAQFDWLYAQDLFVISGALNIRSTQIVTSGLSLGRTLFVCIVLTLGALLFSKDANDLALRPIERMIDKVNKIAHNPISARD